MTTTGLQREVIAHTDGDQASPAQVEAVRRFLDNHHRVFVLTGAGLSTASGIPDYRDRDGSWKGVSPMAHQDFMQSAAMRQRYWARSMAGWPAIARTRPNAGHLALARLAGRGRISLLVTQNVDGLHEAAGQMHVIDLHGRLDQVICVDCGARYPRGRIQDLLVGANAHWLHDSGVIRPDGDIELGDVDYGSFIVPDCPECGGVLKPDVVFFGGGVPRPIVEQAFAALEESDAVLVVGSSLMVWSGYRFVRKAAELGLPIMAINHGHTRADALITEKVDAECTRLLAAAIG